MGRYFDDRRLHEIVRRAILASDPPKLPRVAFHVGGTVVERLGTDNATAERRATATAAWERCPCHETLNEILAIGEIPARGAHSAENDAVCVGNRYLSLFDAHLEVRNDLPRRFFDVPREHEHLWHAAARTYFRGELSSVVEGGYDHRRVRDSVVDIVGAFALPHFNHHLPHFMGQQLWLVRASGNGVRKVIVEVARAGAETDRVLQRRDHILRLGYEHITIDRAWALHDPLRCILAVSDVLLGGDLCGSLIGPASLDRAGCAICGEPMVRVDPTDILSTRSSFGEAFPEGLERFAHADCFFKSAA